MSGTKDSKKDWSQFAEDEIPTEDNIENFEADASQPELEQFSKQELQQKLIAAEQAVEKYRNDLLRGQAEIQNILRRSKLDVENAHKFANEKLLRELVDVVDNLERSVAELDNAPAELSQLKTGIDLTYKMFLDVLAKFGVKQINPENEAFNPTYHEAMSLLDDKNFPTNHVIKVLQKGYQLHDRLVRPAMVIVAK